MRGCCVWIEVGRIENREPSRTPPWAKLIVDTLGRIVRRDVINRVTAGDCDARRSEMRKISSVTGPDP